MWLFSCRENLDTFSDATFPGDIGIIYVDAVPCDEALALLAQRRVALMRRQAEVLAAPAHPGAIIIPLIPLYAASYGADALMIGLLSGAYPVMQLMAAPVRGRLSDRFGRKPVLLFS